LKPFLAGLDKTVGFKDLFSPLPIADVSGCVTGSCKKKNLIII